MDALRSVRDFLFGDPLPQDDGGTVTEWVRLAQWSETEQIVVLALAAAILLLSAWNVRRVRGMDRRAILLSLRAVVVGVLLFAFFQPALLEERSARSRNTIVVLADDSASMALPHQDRSRRDLVRDFLKAHEPTWRKLEEADVVDAYRFGETLEGGDWREIGQHLSAGYQHTHLAGVLEELHDAYRDRDVGGVIILSDGIDTGRLGRSDAGAAGLDRETLDLLEGFNAPVHTFGLAADSVRDAAVHELRYSPFAFKRNQSTIEAEVRVHGYDGGMLEVELLEEGHLVRSVKAELEPGKTVYTASFEFTPTELGHRVYSVRVRPFAEEVTLENNERHAVIRVNRDKIRVLQIAGRPSWDVRYLRNHLSRTPNIQLISFFILINTRGSLRTTSSRETALIPFPAKELFVNELMSFDLVVLQDFPYGPFSTPQHLHRIRDYVKQGGALLVVGGHKALGAGDYAGTELSEVLPVDMVDRGVNEDALDTTEFRARLTDAGKTHPITRLRFDPASNEALWAKLPVLEGANLSYGLANDGITLVDHPTLNTRDGKPMPIVAINEPADGRSAVIATDSLWRFAMPWVGEGGQVDDYHTIMRNMIRWLIKDPELDLVRVSPSTGVTELGGSLELEVRVFQPDYRPAVRQKVSLTITRRPRAGTGAGASAEVVHKAVDLETDEHGRHLLTFDPQTAGIYDVKATSLVAGRMLEANTVFVTSDERPEMRRVVAHDGLLSQLAEATGGVSGTLSDRDVQLNFRPPRVSEVTSRRYHERWNVPGVFFLACLLFASEWWLRRRYGLL